MRGAPAYAGIALAVLAGTAPAQNAYDELVVVTASRKEQRIADAPAAVTVFTDLDIARTPSDDFGDLLRNVPGLNVSQTSGRDINVTARGSTRTLANSQITMLDGRSTYLDFFGINMWDLLPVQAGEIDRIEIVRGPGSALYGANAMSGIVNVITKRPRDMTGTTVVIGTPYANLVHAQGGDRFSYKVSAGYFEQAPYARPSGKVPGSSPPQVYPDFVNEGTTRTRANARFDWGLGGDGYVTFGAGMASTDGIMHTGIGPFDIDKGSELSYLQADYHLDELHLGVSAQLLDGDATNLLTLAADGLPLDFEFVNDTYDITLSNTGTIGGDRHVVTYGGNVRRHDFELTIAPMADGKDEWGLFVQDDIRITGRLRWILGIRYDEIDALRDGVLTPRTSLVHALARGHSLRLSYNEAFRTPSTVNSFLAVRILQSPAPDLAVSAEAFGNTALTEEKLEAWEIGYVGSLDNGMRLTTSVYRNTTRDSIDFFVAGVYGPTDLPAAGPTLPTALIPCFAVAPGSVVRCPEGGLAGVVPSRYGYRNIGETVDRGLELSIDQDLGAWYWWANLSWQDDPDIEGADPLDVNRAPKIRANLGVGRDAGGFFWNANVNYQDEAYWADVLFARAETDAFAQLHASLGWRFHDADLTVELIGQNLFGERVQQHIFGDIIGRKIAGQVSLSF